MSKSKKRVRRTGDRRSKRPRFGGLIGVKNGPTVVVSGGFESFGFEASETKDVTVDDYGRIRRAHRDGMSIREMARRFHRSRSKIRQILRGESEPKPYAKRSRQSAPKLGPFKTRVLEILKEDESAPPKHVTRRCAREACLLGTVQLEFQRSVYSERIRRLSRWLFERLQSEDGPEGRYQGLTIQSVAS